MSSVRLLPFAAVLLAGGCVTDYGYYQGTYYDGRGGDYYVGTPRIAYYAPYGYYRGYSPYVDPGIYGYGYGWYGWYRGSAYPGPYPYPGGHPYWSAAYRGGPYGGGSYWGGYHLRDPYWGTPYWRSAYGIDPYWGPSIHYRQYYDSRYYGGGYYRHGYRPRSTSPPVNPPGPYVERVNPRDGVRPPRPGKPIQPYVRRPPPPSTHPTSPPTTRPTSPPQTRPVPTAPTTPATPFTKRPATGTGPRARKTVDPPVD